MDGWVGERLRLVGWEASRRKKDVVSRHVNCRRLHKAMHTHLKFSIVDDLPCMNHRTKPAKMMLATRIPIAVIPSAVHGPPFAAVSNVVLFPHVPFAVLLPPHSIVGELV